MMKTMAEAPKLEKSFEISGLHEMGDSDTQKISVSDHMNGFQCKSGEESDNFVVDLESFSHGGVDKGSSPNSRITLLRSFSRKGSSRGGVEKPNSGSTPMEKRDRGLAENNNGEKPAPATMGAKDQPGSPQVHHQITVTTANIGASPAAENKRVLKRCGSRRVAPWGLDPRRILFLFATVSSMGTILLIYFTLSMGKLREGGDNLNW